MPQELLRPPHQILVNHVASRLPRPSHARLPLPQRPQLFRVFPLRPRSLQRHLPSFRVKLRDSRPRDQRSRARSSRPIPPQRRRARVRLPSSSRHVRPPAPRQPRDRRARHRLFDRFRRVSPRRPDVRDRRVVVHRVARHRDSIRFVVRQQYARRAVDEFALDARRARRCASSIVESVDGEPDARSSRAVESRGRVAALCGAPTIDAFDPPRAIDRTRNSARSRERGRSAGDLSTIYLVCDRIRARKTRMCDRRFSAIGTDRTTRSERFYGPVVRRPLRKGKILGSIPSRSRSYIKFF